MNNHRFFEKLSARYYKFTYRVAAKILRPHHDIESVLQEAWLRIFKHTDKLRGEMDEGARIAYILTTVKNECKRHLEKNTRKD